MNKLIHSTVEALHYLFSGDADDKDEIPYKEKRRDVVLYATFVGGAIFLYWLLSKR